MQTKGVPMSTSTGPGVPSSTDEPTQLPPSRERPPRFEVRDLAARASLIWIWAAITVVFIIIEPHTFLQVGTFKTIFGSQFALVFLAVAVICTFVVGEFDLSVASILGLGATLVPLLIVHDGWPAWLATIVALLACLAVGCINGFLVVKVGVDAIVVTLGMSTFVLGITLWVTNLNAQEGLSSGYSSIANTNLLGLPIAFWCGLLACIILTYVLTRTPLGRRMAFVGSSREVARLAGINVARLRFGAYAFGGLICGVGGVLLSASLGGFDPNTSAEYLLPAFAAVFLGTAVISPGKFNAMGAFIAVYFLQTGIVGLELRGLQSWIEDVFYGGALVLAVAAITVIRKRSVT
jgi:ribose transport system permease protein